MVGTGPLIGRSNSDADMAAASAAQEGVDYFCVGPTWATPTKPGRAAAGLELVEYRDTEGLLAGTKEAIRKCLQAGFRRHDIAVISLRGREGSALLGLDQLGPHPIRRFTGRYDLLGQPVFTDGELLVESVYRFKGQAAPAVVLSEVDFESLDERTVRKLFVGATRATMKLVIVASARAARPLRAALGVTP